VIIGILACERRLMRRARVLARLDTVYGQVARSELRVAFSDEADRWFERGKRDARAGRLPRTVLLSEMPPRYGPDYNASWREGRGVAKPPTDSGTDSTS
jgi:hypothetical protein